jgi:putative tryptophan/tyrosine transport system substrate-binding protein
MLLFLEVLMRRRELVASAVAVMAAGPVFGQQPAPKVPRLGIISPAQSDDTAIFRALREGLREHGYVEGRNIILEFRLARGDYEALPRLVSELVNLPVDVILTDGGPGVAQLAKGATQQIPIVMGTSGGDPVASGLVASFSRPGGNLTGLTLMQRELSAKRVDVLKAAVPETTAITVLLNPANPGAETNFRATEEAARTAGITTITRIEASPEQLRALSPTTLKTPLLVIPDAMLWNHRSDILAWATRARAPGVYPEREYADDGGLIGYGPNVPNNFRKAASYVDRILKGAKPGDLPIEEPSKIDFVVNLKTAKALGIQLPTAILIRADEVIE